jgi:hypothetical protein
VQLTVTSVDYAPDELYEQAPFVVELLRQMPGKGRDDYWLGSVTPPLRWMVDGVERSITHVVVSARWVGGRFVSGARDLPLNISFVTDASLLDDAQVTASKCVFVAIGVCDETGRSR